MVTFYQAVASLRPNTAFSVSSENADDITWITSGVVPPTTKEIEDEMARLEKAIIHSAADKEAAKASALAKLQTLGLTEQEAEAIAGL